MRTDGRRWQMKNQRRNEIRCCTHYDLVDKNRDFPNFFTSD
jgi:hypothetical protein